MPVLYFFRLEIDMSEDKNISLSESNESGGKNSVQIADDVISTIAALAATEIEGVASVAGSLRSEIIAKLGVKNLKRGVKLHMEDGVWFDISINVVYGYDIPSVCAKVKEKVTSTVQNMTGLTVKTVNVSVMGVDISNPEA